MVNHSNSKKARSGSTTRRDGSDAMRSAFVREIERLRIGEVSSYGEIAERAGYPRRHRAVGQLLSASFDSLPWWRVVYADGHLPPINPTLQSTRLIEEGVIIDGTRVTDAPHGSFADGSKND